MHSRLEAHSRMEDSTLQFNFGTKFSWHRQIYNTQMTLSNLMLHEILKFEQYLYSVGSCHGRSKSTFSLYTFLNHIRKNKIQRGSNTSLQCNQLVKAILSCTDISESIIWFFSLPDYTTYNGNRNCSWLLNLLKNYKSNARHIIYEILKYFRYMP